MERRIKGWLMLVGSLLSSVPSLSAQEDGAGAEETEAWVREALEMELPQEPAAAEVEEKAQPPAGEIKPPPAGEIKPLVPTREMQLQAAQQHAERARQRFQERDLKGAQRAWEEAVSLVSALPASRDVQEFLGRAYLHLGWVRYEQLDAKGAEREFRKALHWPPNEVEAYVGLSLARLLRNDVREAKRFCALALRREDWPLAHFGLGAALWDSGQEAAAATEFRKALGGGLPPEPFARLARLALETYAADPPAHPYTTAGLNLRDELVQAYRNPLFSAYRRAYHHFQRARLLRRRGDYQEALAEYQRALRAFPELPEAHVNRADLYAVQRQWDRAVDEYRQALQLRPDLPEAHYGLGLIYRQQNQRSEAIAEFQRALELGLPADLATRARQYIAAARRG